MAKRDQLATSLGRHYPREPRGAEDFAFGDGVVGDGVDRRALEGDEPLGMCFARGDGLVAEGFITQAQGIQ